MRLIKLLTENLKVGYRLGGFQHPSETLKDRGWYFASNVGYLGTGYYFVSTLDKATDIKKTVRQDDLYQIDLSGYRLFRASDPIAFYEDIKQITKLVGEYSKDSLLDDLDEDAFVEIYEIIKSHGISMSENNFRTALDGFIKDVHYRKDGTLLSNRILEPLGYDGIDNTGIEDLDNFGTGSVIFSSKFKPDTAQKS